MALDQVRGLKQSSTGPPGQARKRQTRISPLAGLKMAKNLTGQHRHTQGLMPPANRQNRKTHPLVLANWGASTQREILITRAVLELRVSSPERLSLYPSSKTLLCFGLVFNFYSCKAAFFQTRSSKFAYEKAYSFRNFEAAKLAFRKNELLRLRFQETKLLRHCKMRGKTLIFHGQVGECNLSFKKRHRSRFRSGCIKCLCSQE